MSEEPKKKKSSKRRKIAKWTGILGLVFTGAVGPEAYQTTFNTCEVAVDTDRYDELGELPSSPTASFYTNAYGYRPYTLMGDTNHSDIGIRNFVYSRENINFMETAGIHHLFLEMDRPQNTLLDQLSDDEISHTEFAERIGHNMWLEEDEAIQANIRFANTVSLLEEKGIEAHAADTPIVVTRNMDSNDFQVFEDFTTYFNESCPNAPAMHGRIAVNFEIRQRLGLEEMSSTQDETLEELVTQRDNDNEQVGYIRSIAENNSSVIFFGSGHFSNNTSSMRSILADDALYVEIYSTRELYSDWWMSNETDEDSPDFVHIIDEGKVYQTGDITFQDLENAARNRELAPEAMVLAQQ